MQMLQPQILLLKEGADTSQGKNQLLTNITACEAIVQILKTTLGPRGMDKLIHSHNASTTITNDGATIIQLLDIIHPAAKTLCEIAKSQDDEIGDGTTSVVLFAGSFLKAAKGLIEDGIHVQNIIKAFQIGCQMAVKWISEDLSIDINQNQNTNLKRQERFEHCAQTALNSKLIENEKLFFSKMIVNAVLKLDSDDFDIKMIGIKNVSGGALRDSYVVEGVAFKKTFSYAGFEQQRKKIISPKIALLNVELELKSESTNAEIRIRPEKYQSIVDAEWKVIYKKLEQIVDSGAQIILSKLPIGDLATQYFADRDLFCAGRVPSEDLERVAAATGGVIQTSLNGLNDENVLGNCGIFEEKQIGKERFNVFTDCSNSKTMTIILRGGANQFIQETERSLHDAIMVVKRVIHEKKIVAGGGAIEMEISKLLKHHARTLSDKSGIILNSYARAFEIIPKQLAENAGFDSTDILNQLRLNHAKGEKYSGVDIDSEQCLDMFSKFVWEPIDMKINAIASATEAACLILSVDETIRNPKSESSTGQNIRR